MSTLAQLLADAGLPWLYALAFLLMGCFVSLYNYLGYRLAGARLAVNQCGGAALRRRRRDEHHRAVA